MGLGLAIANINELAIKYVLAFVSGNFLYLALIMFFPYIKKQKTMKMKLFCCFASLLGITFMYLVTLAEH